MTDNETEVVNTEEYIAQLREKLRLKRGLPHLFGHKLYKWQRQYLESTNKKNFLTAANQIGKSLINIKRTVKWATDKDLWKKLWPHYERVGQFWYCYPDYKLATTEFHEKWVTEVLPRQEHLTEEEWNIYGWKARFDRGEIRSISFNSGVTVYFKAYSQKPTALQAGTVFAIFCDEELPVIFYDEFKFRLSATEGYFNMVFTATLGQELWRQVMEEKGDNEKFPDAFKQQISLYDCLVFEDGTKSNWTEERIKSRIADCSTQQEIDKRIYGKFVKAEGLKYPTFRREDHIKPYDPKAERGDWFVFAGLDYGSGGEDGHPSAICFVRVNPDYTRGEIFVAWRGDNLRTTAGDLLQKYYDLVMNHKLSGKITGIFYDYHCRDLKTLSERIGESFFPANKKHDEGELILNTLFKHNALVIIEDPNDEESGSEKLAYELATVSKEGDKRKLKDDLADGLRYSVTSIPWNLEKIRQNEETKDKEVLSEIALRRKMIDEHAKIEYDNCEEEISFWNSMID